MANTVRTRFAPSPTGSMHIGNLRTALYAYLYAKSNKGVFILRIEDTDRARYVDGATQLIYDTLKSAGLKWDEGPDVGGKYGPYIQSERKSSYLRYAEELVHAGKAYYCFCSKERLSTLKNDDGISFYDGCCRGLAKDHVIENIKNGIPGVIRQKMPKTGTAWYNDLVYGTVEIENRELEDQVLIKSDGLPTYNFANVIDDHLMDITHIIRGNEYLVSTPKYNLLYEAFGWKAPEYIHLPRIMLSKTESFSKRSGSMSYGDMLNEGFLPQAIINYIALLGWSPGTTRELFSLKELEGCFDIGHINRSPAIFDRNKLLWMNGEYLRMMDKEEFYETVKPYLEKCIVKELDLHSVSSLLQKRVTVLSEISDMVDFFNEVSEYDKNIYVNKKMKTDLEVSLASLRLIYERLSVQEDFSNDALFASLSELASKNGMKNSQILWPLRTSVTGRETSPGGATEIASILGKQETLRRVSDAVALLDR